MLGQPASADLEALLKWQRLGDSGAYISSGYYDWRGPSRYRRVPGLHHGYDIAMLPGSLVRSPWAGTVVAITPWYGAEYGISVRLLCGREVTFGHLSPRVTVGTQIRPGTVVGTVVVDHVDVKARDRSGAYLDFGTFQIATEPSLAHPFSNPEGSPLPQVSKEDRKAFEKYENLAHRYRTSLQAYRKGLLAERQVRQLEEQMAALEPMAKRYARSIRAELPKGTDLESPAGDETSNPEFGRPVADRLLLLDGLDSTEPESPSNSALE